MPSLDIAVTLDSDLLAEVDRLVSQRIFPNRNEAIERAVRDELALIRNSGLAEDSGSIAETALLSEAALAEDWNRPEEDAAWAHLQRAK